jgi:transcriptional regulator with PAS, ATPase and Fis domain
VLIEGESGTGKELVARALHRLSSRRNKPFIAVNVGALPETLLESELFGHEKGAFTGAAERRIGRFELADTGTLFLDEIGEIPIATQVKLLRVLEEREFVRLGGVQPIRVNVRVIAATNRPLRQHVDEGSFRTDLFYRLNVLNIHLPPLRERPEDVPHLVRKFISDYSAEHDRPFHGISAEAMQLLADYPWPGNVRELRNLIESMVVLSPGREIRPDDLPRQIRDGGSARSPRRTPTAGSWSSSCGRYWSCASRWRSCDGASTPAWRVGAPTGRTMADSSARSGRRTRSRPTAESGRRWAGLLRATRRRRPTWWWWSRG